MSDEPQIFSVEVAVQVSKGDQVQAANMVRDFLMGQREIRHVYVPKCFIFAGGEVGHYLQVDVSADTLDGLTSGAEVTQEYTNKHVDTLLKTLYKSDAYKSGPFTPHSFDPSRTLHVLAGKRGIRIS